jgi:hypothetical protein
MIGNESFSQVGGARFDFFNATWPFVKIYVSPNTIKLKCFSKKYTFEKDQIVDLREYAGMMSKGLLIEHKHKNYPHHMVFWTFKFNRLKHNLERLGYMVNIPKKSDAWYKGGP